MITRSEGTEVPVDAPYAGVLRDEFLSSDWFEHEMATLFRPAWSMVGHISQIPGEGDWFRAETGRASLLVVRGRNGGVRSTRSADTADRSYAPRKVGAESRSSRARTTDGAMDSTANSGSRHEWAMTSTKRLSDSPPLTVTCGTASSTSQPESNDRTQ